MRKLAAHLSHGLCGGAPWSGHHRAVEVDADLVQHRVYQLLRLPLLVLALSSARKVDFLSF